MELFLDLHTRVPRQGPGSNASTAQALRMLGELPPQLHILDIGCGAGAQTLALADQVNGKIVALDCNQCFLDELRHKINELGLQRKITPMLGSMFDLAFPDNTFDVIWSEGAIYIAGFEKGIQDWRRFVKPGGFLVASEISWLRRDIPAELEAYWKEQYAGIDFISAKIAQIETCGYAPFGYFVLPESAWLEGYYGPLLANREAFLADHGNSPEAHTVLEEMAKEVAMYEKYSKYYGYVFYLARKVA